MAGARELIPNATPIAPLSVTQHTATAAFGFKNPRAFLEFVARHELAHTRDGKSVFVDVETLRSKLRELAVAGEPLFSALADDGDVPTTGEGVLAALGLRRSK